MAQLPDPKASLAVLHTTRFPLLMPVSLEAQRRHGSVQQAASRAQGCVQQSQVQHRRQLLASVGTGPGARSPTQPLPGTLRQRPAPQAAGERLGAHGDPGRLGEPGEA